MKMRDSMQADMDIMRPRAMLWASLLFIAWLTLVSAKTCLRYFSKSTSDLNLVRTRTEARKKPCLT